jgi:hypothetical protein
MLASTRKHTILPTHIAFAIREIRAIRGLPLKNSALLRDL